MNEYEGVLIERLMRFENERMCRFADEVCLSVVEVEVEFDDLRLPLPLLDAVDGN